MVPKGGTMGLQTDFFLLLLLLILLLLLLLLLLFLVLHPPIFLFLLGTEKHQFSNWFDFPGNSSDSYLFLLILLLFPGVFFVWRTVHRLQEVQ